MQPGILSLSISYLEPSWESHWWPKCSWILHLLLSLNSECNSASRLPYCVFLLFTLWELKYCFVQAVNLVATKNLESLEMEMSVFFWCGIFIFVFWHGPCASSGCPRLSCSSGPDEICTEFFERTHALETWKAHILSELASSENADLRNLQTYISWSSFGKHHKQN